MGMVVRSNIMAVNAQRQLGVNNNQVSKALEKLSSGYRINRAGDDASGLAISEKMKAQIKGLDTASLNAQDGISVVQTAEGALTEVHNMLNRMVELATRSANGINADQNRSALQEEVTALQAEIDRIAQSTTFNDIHLLDGTGGSGGTTGGTTGSVAEFDAPTATTIASPTDGDGTGTSATFDFDVAGFAGTKAGTVDVKIGDVVVGTVDVTEGMTDAEFADALNGQKFTVQDTAGNDLEFTATVSGTTVTFTAADDSAIALSGGSADFDVTGGYTIEAQQPAAAAAAAGDAAEAPDFSTAADVAVADFDGNGNKADVKVSTLDGAKIQEIVDALAEADETFDGGNVTIEWDGTSKYLLKVGTETIGEATDTLNGTADGTGKDITFTSTDGNNTALGKVTVTPNGAALAGELNGTIDTGVAATPAGGDNNGGGTTGGGSTFVLQIGDTAASYNQLTFTIKSMTSASIGVDATSVDISTLTGAQGAIQTVKNAIDTVSTERAKLGAIQNRLEYTINNLDTTSENMQAANSRIRDTDMAKMMMEYTKVNVVTQSAQAMLAQANQQPQSVLQLLQ